MHRLMLTAMAALALAVPARAQGPELTTRDVAIGLDTPWEILWGPDDHIWMTERAGRVSRVNPETGAIVAVYTVPDVYEQSESGLLGMALHPDFESTPWVYLVYNYRVGSTIAERLVRWRYNGQTLVEPDTLLDAIPGYPTHDGSRLLVLADRTLLMTTGDAQDQPAAQRHTALTGKILRMNLDGSPAADNPFSGAAYPANLMWTSGHRNPQGLVQGPNGIVYSSEHGPENDDEVNIIESRGNYGWPTVHGFCDQPTEEGFCQDSNVVEPIAAWTPTLAVAGLDYYAHDAIPEWNGSLLMVSLKEADLRQLKLSVDGRTIVSQTVFFDNRFGRLRDVCISPDGRVFIATSNRDGRGRSPFPAAGDDRIIEIRGGILGLGSGEESAGRGTLQVTLDPTTASAACTVTLDVLAAGSVHLSVTDVTGRMVLQERLDARAGRLRHSMDLRGLVPGAYFVRVAQLARNDVATILIGGE